MSKNINQEYCTHDYWLDYPRQIMVKIDSIDCLSEEDKQSIRQGKSASKYIGSYMQYFYPIIGG